MTRIYNLGVKTFIKPNYNPTLQINVLVRLLISLKNVDLAGVPPIYLERESNPIMTSVMCSQYPIMTCVLNMVSTFSKTFIY